MAPFSAASLANLAGVHPVLVRVLTEVTRDFDCTILGSTQRTEAQQAVLVAQGLSKTLKSLHLIQADGYRHAVDVAPTPLHFDDSPPSGLTKYEVDMLCFLFYTKGYAKAQGVTLRIGGDWNGNQKWADEAFRDLDHIELPVTP